MLCCMRNKELIYYVYCRYYWNQEVRHFFKEWCIYSWTWTKETSHWRCGNMWVTEMQDLRWKKCCWRRQKRNQVYEVWWVGSSNNFDCYLIHFNDKCLNLESRGINTTFWPPLKIHPCEPLLLYFVLGSLPMLTRSLSTHWLWILRQSSILTAGCYSRRPKINSSQKSHWSEFCRRLNAFKKD